MNENNINITNSAEETEKLGEEFAKKIKPGEVVCLFGDLGSGKTTFVKGVARGLGIKTRLISPTFILVRKHKISIRYQVSGIKYMYHIDLYRLKDKKEAESIDLKEILEDRNAVIIIEWAEKAENILPKERWDISFNYIAGNRRKISIEKV